MEPTLTPNDPSGKKVRTASYQRKATITSEAYRKYLCTLFRTKTARSPR
jgi:hypothetical protein